MLFWVTDEAQEIRRSCHSIVLFSYFIIHPSVGDSLASRPLSQQRLVGFRRLYLHQTFIASCLGCMMLKDIIAIFGWNNNVSQQQYKFDHKREDTLSTNIYITLYFIYYVFCFQQQTRVIITFNRFQIFITLLFARDKQIILILIE